MSFSRVSYANMRKKMKEVVRYKFTARFPFSQVCDFASVVSNMRKKMKKVVRDYFTAWFSFSQVCDFASVVSTSETGLPMALVVPASETVLIQRRRLKEWRTKR